MVSIAELGMVSEKGVHFELSLVLRDKLLWITAPLLEFDLRDVKDKDSLLNAFAVALKAPFYSGNWDSLIDILEDLSWFSPEPEIFVLSGSQRLWCEQTFLMGTLTECLIAVTNTSAKLGKNRHFVFAL